jgi:hypothetical protein
MEFSQFEKEKSQMRETTRPSRFRGGSAGVALAALCMVFAFAPSLPGQGEPGQEQGVTVPPGWFDPGLRTTLLPPGGPTPRTEDGHPDLTGRYYPNGLGRMIGSYTVGRDQMDTSVTNVFAEGTPPQVEPVFRPETVSKYQYPTPYGICAPGGTPTSITTQRTEHGPMEIIQKPGVVWILSEFPQTIRRIPTDGSPHPPDPDVTFNGDSRGRWEGDTLVVETIAIDTRMRNISVGRSGDRNAWTHSEQERVIERFSRPSENFLVYQLTVEDPVVLAQPFVSAPMRWSRAQDPDDVWTEYHCTANKDADAYQTLDQEFRENYETGGQQP